MITQKMYLKAIGLVITIGIMLALFFTFTINASAEDSLLQKVEKNATNELKQAKTPKAAIGVIQGANSDYILYTNKNGDKLNENALFQLGSVSKSFTALGILLLEDEKLIHLSDPVSKYLPQFNVNFDGKKVEDKDLTISNLIYQTSGFISNDTKYPGASSGMTLEENVMQHSGKSVMFYPSTQFAYSNVNYITLGLIIEAVSGQSYEKFITDKLLLPLGLVSTYADLQALSSGKEIVKGSKLSFFNAFDYEIKAEQGNVPAGYIYSSLKDVCRYAQIQLGEIVISQQFTRIIEKSHTPNFGSVVDKNTNYAAGWFVNTQTNEVYHSGGTANYSTNISMRMDSHIAACILTNMNASANTNNIAANALNILEGKPVLAYQPDIWMIFDIIFSLITIVGSLAIIVIIFFIVWQVLQIKSGKRKKVKFAIKNLLVAIPAFALTVLTIAVAVIVPMVFGSTWLDIGIWSPYSLLWGMGILVTATILFIGFAVISVIFKKMISTT